MKQLLAIDPGPVESAYVVWDGTKILQHGKVPTCGLLGLIYAHVRYPCAKLAIEMIASYGMPVGAEVFETCVVIGRIVQSWRNTIGLDPVRITRNEVKNHLCHSSKARDSNIRQAIIDRLGPPGTKKAPGLTYGIKADEWSALAVALTVWDREESKWASK